LNYYVVNDETQALQAIQLLEEHKKGKANFFLLNKIKDFYLAKKEIPQTKNALEAYLKTEDFAADVMIQLCYNLEDQPINKLNVEWKNAPYIKIGQVRIKKNDLLDPEACESELLSFNPFESKIFFQPVGKIQKLRDEAYKVSMQTRLKMNKLLKYNK